MHSSSEKETEYLWNGLRYSFSALLPSTMFSSSVQSYFCLLAQALGVITPPPLLPLTLDAKTMDPVRSQLHLLLNVPFWGLLLMLTHPLDIFS